MDEVDAFISGVNMLGEEMKDKTISRDYFNNIFNSVSDMVFVLDKQGKIENINQSVAHHLHYSLGFSEKKTDKLFAGQIATGLVR
jgi:transcriptional regulator with PAS, ATPase and Fis domain